MDSEFQRELALLQQDGLKTNPMRLAYEEKVRGLQALKEELLAQGCSTEELAHRLHTQQRELGRAYKEMAPPLFRAYIYLRHRTEIRRPAGAGLRAASEEENPRGDHRLRYPAHCGFGSAADLGWVHPVV